MCFLWYSYKLLHYCNFCMRIIAAFRGGGRERDNSPPRPYFAPPPLESGRFINNYTFCTTIMMMTLGARLYIAETKRKPSGDYSGVQVDTIEYSRFCN